DGAASCAFREVEELCRVGNHAFAAGARPSDHRRSRTQGIRVDGLVCRLRTGENSEAHHREAERGIPRGLERQDVSEKLRTAGIEPEASSPDGLRKFQGLETEKWKKIVADAKIEPE